ncbi:MAG: hypothetical protein K0R78_902 [Pelosinus sp.]|nr:hypothetical protein [Pelosinus sp.]
MATIEEAIERIKALECPTGDIEKRVKGILTDYKIAIKSEIMVNREHDLDKNGVRGYRAKTSREGGADITILAVSGGDDYVAKVSDAYIN